MILIIFENIRRALVDKASGSFGSSILYHPATNQMLSGAALDWLLATAILDQMVALQIVMDYNAHQP